MVKRLLKRMKDQAGLTLVELLAVIVILGVIAAIAVPSIGGIISSSKTKADTQTSALVADATLKYLELSDPAIATTVTTVAVDDLVAGGYLKSDPSYQVGTFPDNITVSYTSTKGWSVTTPTATP